MKNKYFYIWGIVALIVLTVGVTYAVFVIRKSATISGNAAHIDVSLVSGDSVLVTSLIPSSETDVNTAYANAGSNKCVSNGYCVCSVYTFSVTNNMSKGQISINGLLNSSLNQFSNLKYKVVKTSGSDSGTITTTKTSAPAANASGNLFTSYVIAAGSTVSFDVIIWLDETSTNQTAEMDKTFAGNIRVATSSGIEANYD